MARCDAVDLTERNPAPVERQVNDPISCNGFVNVSEMHPRWSSGLDCHEIHRFSPRYPSTICHEKEMTIASASGQTMRNHKQLHSLWP